MNMFNKLGIKLMSEKRWEETLIHAITEYDTPQFELLLKAGRCTNFSFMNKNIESETPLTLAISRRRERVPLLLQSKADPNTLVGQRYSAQPFNWVPVSPILLALENHTQPGMDQVYIALRNAGGKLYGRPVNEDKLKTGQEWLRDAPKKIQSRLEFKKLSAIHEQWEAEYQKLAVQKAIENVHTTTTKRLKI